MLDLFISILSIFIFIAGIYTLKLRIDYDMRYWDN